MKSFQQFNENKSEKTLLTNLFSFYYKKYKDQGTDVIEDKFLKNAMDLISNGEISVTTLDKFIEDNGIETVKPKVKKKDLSVKRTKTGNSGNSANTSSGFGNSCGGGSTSYC